MLVPLLQRNIKHIGKDSGGLVPADHQYRPSLCRLAELNVRKQVHNVCTSPAVQRAWEEGKSLSVHGFLLVVEDGTLQELLVPITSLEEAMAFKHTVVVEKVCP